MKPCFILSLIVLFFSKTYGQVNLQTGTPQVNIPLYEISDKNNRLNTSISLNYTAGNGLNVDDPGSSSGTGWDIMAGGYVSRKVIGEPDDQAQFNTFPEVYYLPDHEEDFNQQQADFANYVDNYYPNGYLYSEYPVNDAITNRAALTLMNRGIVLPPQRYLTDKQQDIFTFNINGRTGQFCIGKDKSVLLLNQKDKFLKIQPVFDGLLYNQGIRTTLKSFTITDENGIQYVFEDMDLDEVIKYKDYQNYNVSTGQPSGSLGHMTYQGPVGISGPDCDADGNSSQVIMQGATTNSFICNNWRLSKIINPLTLKSIDFTYVSEPVSNVTGYNADKSESDGHCSISIIKNSSSSQVKKLVSITNEYGDKVEFVYNDVRKDLPADKVLNQINYYEKGILISKYKFGYSYFYKSFIKDFSYAFSASDLPYIRLCLSQIQKAGYKEDLSEQPMKFDYYTYSAMIYDPSIVADMVPPRFTFYKDAWNYFNGANGYQSALVPLPGYSYPLNVYNHTSDIRNQLSGLFAENGLIKGITYPTGGTLTYTYEPRYVLYNNTNTQIGGVRVRSTLMQNGVNESKIQTDYSYVLSTDNSKSSGWGYNPPVFQYSIPVHKSDCYDDSKPSVTLFSVAKSAIKVILTGNPFSYFEQVGLFILSGWFHHSNAEDFTVTYHTDKPINYNNLLPLEYSQVKVSNTSNGQSNGSVIYTFISPSDYSLEIPNDDLLYSNRQRFRYWKYGLAKKIDIYNNKVPTPGLLKSTENFYALDNSAEFQTDKYSSLFWKPVQIGFACNTVEWNYSANTQQTDYINSESYVPLCGKINLIRTDEHNYDNNGNDLLTTTTYQYNTIKTANDGFLALKTTKNSKGEKTETSYKYSIDYNGSAAITTMKSNNNIAALILQESYIYKNQSDKYITSGTITEYDLPSGSTQLANGQFYTQNKDIQPGHLYQLRSLDNTMVNDNLLQPFNPAYVVRDHTYYQSVEGFDYDRYGSVTHLHTEQGNQHYIYDDVISDRLLAVVSAKSITPYACAYTSFENISKGNWAYSGAIIKDLSSPTGNYVYDLGQTNGSITYSFTGTASASDYIVSYWSKNSSNNNYYSVTGSSNPIKGNTSNGWTYYEHSVSNTSPITISGNGYIDELRLYPKQSLMESYTYDPIFGNINSKSDANNKVTHIEYDNLGRKAVVSDQDRNIVKTYCYNFSGQPSDCKIGYQSGAFTGIFNSNNCTSQQSGNNFLYSAPAGKYFSYSSQEEADNQAIQDINMNGQQYANSQTTNCSTNTVTLKNSTSYSTNNTATIDGIQYVFPPAGSSTVLSITLVNGSHTIKLSSGPSNCYNINGVTYNASQTNPELHYTTNGNLIINYISSCTNPYAPPYKNVAIVNPVRNDCAVGQTGSQVVYTVPAGTYTSSVSQDDADNQAIATAQAWAHTNGNCTENKLNKIYLKNTSTSSDPHIYVLIDGYKFYFPASGGNTFVTFLPPGQHTFSFSCGPEFDYMISPGTSFYCAATQPAVKWNINSDVTLICGTTTIMPDPYKTLGGNITSATSVPSGFCCHGCSYTGTLYMASSASLTAGTQLYTNSTLTQPVTGVTWFFPYSEGDGNTIYQITSDGKIGNVTQTCP